MKLVVNGKERAAKEGMTLAELVRELSLETHPIAVERNLAVVPKDLYGSVRLGDGDRIEIVSLVGGG